MNTYSSPAASEREKARRSETLRYVFVRVVLGHGARTVAGSKILAARRDAAGADTAPPTHDGRR